MWAVLRRPVEAVAVAAAVLAPSIAAAPAAQASAPYSVVQLHWLHGTCLGIRNQSANAGAALEYTRCQNLPSQRFKVMSDGPANPNHEIRTFVEGMCLTPHTPLFDDGLRQPIEQSRCNGSPLQRFTFFGQYGAPEIGVRTATGLCWTVAGGEGDISQYPCENSGPGYQRFTLVYV